MATEIRRRSFVGRVLEAVAWVLAGLMIPIFVALISSVAAGVIAVALGAAGIAILLGKLSLPGIRRARAVGLLWIAVMFPLAVMSTQLQRADGRREAAELAELRVTDPDLYLERLQEGGDETWLQELEVLRPDQYADEVARQEQEAVEREAAQRAERDRITQEREAERAEAREVATRAETEEMHSRFEAALSTAAVAVRQPFVPPANVDDIRRFLSRVDLQAQPFILAERIQLSPDQAARLEILRAEVTDFQTRNFPSVRDAYGPIRRQELWINDTTARTVGPGFRTIQLTSFRYTLNRAIQADLDQLRPNWIRLRFTTAMFIEYEDGPGVRADFDHAAPRDDEIVDWRDGYPRRLQQPTVTQTISVPAQASEVTGVRTLGAWRVDCGVPCVFSIELTNTGEVRSVWTFEDGSFSSRPLAAPEYADGVYRFRFTDEVGVSQGEVAQVSDAGALTIRDRIGVTMSGEPAQRPNMSLLSSGGD